MNNALKGAMDEVDRIRRMMPYLDLSPEAFRKAGMVGPDTLAQSQYIRQIAEQFKHLSRPHLDLSAEAFRKAGMVGRDAFAQSQYIRQIAEQFKHLSRPPLLDAVYNDTSGILRLDLFNQTYREFGQHATLIPLALTELNNNWSRIAEQNQAIVAVIQADAVRSRGLLDPLLRAGSEWLRTAQLPSHSADWRYIADQARALATHIVDSWAAIAAQQTDAQTDEEEQALRFAEDQFSEIIAEKNPRTMLHALRDFFDQTVVKLPHHIGKFLYHFLIHLLVAVVMDTAVGPALHRQAPHHTVAKEVRAEARQMRLTHAQIPCDARVVIASRLIVHQGPSRNSLHVGWLYAGDIVFVEKVRTRSWSLVAYEGADGNAVLKGWVFSRYIKRFSGGRHPQLSH